MSTIVHMDFETRSRVDIWETGAYRYSKHPSTQVLCCAYAINEDPVQLIPREFFSCKRKPNGGETIPLDLLKAITGMYKDVTFKAFNAYFERNITQHILVERLGWEPIPLIKWRCVQAKASAFNLPKSLEKVAEALMLVNHKDTFGGAIMKKLAKPDKATGEFIEDPEMFKKLYLYCKQDVEVEREMDKMLPELTPSEQVVWFVDQIINDRGVRIDKPIIEKIISMMAVYKQEKVDELIFKTCGELESVTKRNDLMRWVNERGIVMEKTDKATVLNLLDSPDTPQEVKEVLEIRKELSLISTEKYPTMITVAGETDRLTDLFFFHAASTGRFGGKLVQSQNLAKPTIPDVEHCIETIRDWGYDEFRCLYPDAMAAFSSCVRSVLIPSEGNKFIAVDYAAIEARVIMWIAGEREALKDFEAGADLYIKLANLIYRTNDIKKGDKRRDLGKAGILGCGFGMGWVKFLAQCLKNGLIITEELSQLTINTYRGTYTRVVKFWYKLEETAIHAFNSPNRIFSVVIEGDKIPIAFERVIKGKLDYLSMSLPSGRRITYYKPETKKVIAPWGDEKLALTYLGLDPDKKARWARIPTYGGKLAENAVQAIARDIMCHALVNLEKQKHNPVMHAHDEIVCDVNKSVTVKEIETIMCTLPKWAAGCPITAEGWEGDRYKK